MSSVKDKIVLIGKLHSILYKPFKLIFLSLAYGSLDPTDLHNVSKHLPSYPEFNEIREMNRINPEVLSLSSISENDISANSHVFQKLMMKDMGSFYQAGKSSSGCAELPVLTVREASISTYIRYIFQGIGIVKGRAASI